MGLRRFQSPHFVSLLDFDVFSRLMLKFCGISVCLVVLLLESFGFRCAQSSYLEGLWALDVPLLEFFGLRRL